MNNAPEHDSKVLYKIIGGGCLVREISSTGLTQNEIYGMMHMFSIVKMTFLFNYSGKCHQLYSIWPYNTKTGYVECK